MDPGGTPPATLAARIAAGRPNAFRELFDRSLRGLVQYATGILGFGRKRATLSGTFFRLWQNRARLDPDSDPARFLYTIVYTIVRNLARDRLWHRAVERRPRPHLEMPHFVQAGPLLADEVGHTDGRQAAVQRALESLSQRQQEIVLLRWRRQLTYEQIGAELGIAPGTVSAHMQRAIGRLKLLLWLSPSTELP